MFQKIFSKCPSVNISELKYGSASGIKGITIFIYLFIPHIPDFQIFAYQTNFVLISKKQLHLWSVLWSPVNGFTWFQMWIKKLNPNSHTSRKHLKGTVYKSLPHVSLHTDRKLIIVHFNIIMFWLRSDKHTEIAALLLPDQNSKHPELFPSTQGM